MTGIPKKRPKKSSKSFLWLNRFDETYFISFEKRGTYEFDRFFLVPVWCVVVALWSREFYISGDWDRSGYESGNGTSQWNCGVCYFALIHRRYVHYLKSWCLQWFLTSGILNQVSCVSFCFLLGDMVTLKNSNIISFSEGCKRLGISDMNVIKYNRIDEYTVGTPSFRFQ